MGDASDASTSPYGSDGEAVGQAKLRDLYRVLVARKKVVLATAATLVAVTMLYTLVATPVYQATATLQIEMLAPEFLTFKDVVNVDRTYLGNSHFYQTQYKLLRSRPVLELAVEKLDPLNRPEYLAKKVSPIARFRRWLSAPPEPVDLSPEEAKKEAKNGAVLAVQGGLAVKPLRDSQLVEVSYVHSDPGFAADVANGVADAYILFNSSSRTTTTEAAREFLTKEVARVTREIADLEASMQDYGSRKDLVSLGDSTQDISEQALADANRRYVDARSRLAVADARLVSVRDVTIDALPEVLNSPLIAKLKEQYAIVERQYGQMAERFKPDWPPLIQVKAEMDQAASRLVTESENIARQVRGVAQADKDRAQAETVRLEAEMQIQKGEVQRAQKDAIQYSGLKAEIQSKRRILENLQTRQSETTSSAELQNPLANNIRIVDYADVPKAPIRPNRMNDLVLSLLVGLVIGVGLAFLVDHLDNTVKSANDVERLAGVAVLGQVPVFQPLRVVGGPEHAAEAPVRLDLTSHQDPRSTFAEAFRSLRTSFLLATPEQPARHVVVSSCQPSEGKSTVSLNLAIVLSQFGRRVLLIDADLRAPRLHNVLGISNGVGLSSYLSGNADADDLVHETGIPNLFTITAGPPPPNPSELLGSPKLEALLDHLEKRGRFDCVVFDSSPLLLVTDPLILSSRLDATIIVVRAGSTSRESLIQGVARLRQSRARVVGAVVNGVQDETDGYYGKYRYHDPKASNQAQSRRPSFLAVASRKRRRDGTQA